MHIVELISTGDVQIMETLHSIGIKLFVLGCTERKLVLPFVILLFCLCCVVPVLMHYRLCLVTLYESTAKWETYQIFKEDRLWVHT